MNRTFIAPGGAVVGGIGKRSILPDLGGRLYAGYILGTDAFGIGRLSGTPGTDLSGNGNDLSFTGAGPGAQWLAGSGVNFATCPFSGRDVWSIANEITLVALATSSATADFQIVGGRSNTVDGHQYFALAHGPGAAVDAFNEPQQSTRGATVAIPRDSAAERDSVKFELLVASWSTRGGQAWRRRFDIGTVTAATLSRPGYGGPDDAVPITIGAAPAVPGANGAGKVAMVMIYAAAVRDIEGALYQPVKALASDLLGLAV